MLSRPTARVTFLWVVMLSVLMVGACGGDQPPITRPAPPPPPAAPPPPPPPAPERIPEPIPIPPEPVPEEEPVASRGLDELNRDSPLMPIFFEYDSSDLGADAQASLTQNADRLKQFGTWVVTIEGHCDERGTAEYNLALGERRALAARHYLTTLGVSADRVRTVSYGKEFPFDPGHDEAAWSRNRRAHFVITAQ